MLAFFFFNVFCINYYVNFPVKLAKKILGLEFFSKSIFFNRFWLIARYRNKKKLRRFAQCY